MHTWIWQHPDGRLAPTLATRREHVVRLRQRSDQNASRQCPRYGSAPVIRSIKRGAKASQQFWGCSTFSQCRAQRPLG